MDFTRERVTGPVEPPEAVAHEATAEVGGGKGAKLYVAKSLFPLVGWSARAVA